MKPIRNSIKSTMIEWVQKQKQKMGWMRRTTKLMDVIKTMKCIGNRLSSALVDLDRKEKWVSTTEHRKFTLITSNAWRKLLMIAWSSQTRFFLLVSFLMFFPRSEDSETSSTHWLVNDLWNFSNVSELRTHEIAFIISMEFQIFPPPFAQAQSAQTHCSG